MINEIYYTWIRTNFENIHRKWYIEFHAQFLRAEPSSAVSWWSESEELEYRNKNSKTYFKLQNFCTLRSPPNLNIPMLSTVEIEMLFPF